MTHLDSFISLIEVSIIYYFLVNYLRKNKKYKPAYLFVSCFMSFIALTMLNIFIDYKGVWVLVVTVIPLIFLHFYTKGTFFAKLFATTFIHALLIITTTVMLVIFNVLFNQNGDIELLLSSNWKALIMFIANALLFLISLLLIHTRRKYEYKIENNQQRSIFFLTLLMFLIALPYIRYFMTHQIDGFLFIIGLFSMILLVLGTVIGYIEFLKINDRIKEDELKLVIQNDQLDRLLGVKELNDDIRVLKEELNQTLSQVIDYIDKGDVDSSIAIVDKYAISVSQKKSVELTNNPTLDYILNLYKEKCIAQQIDFTCTINSACTFDISDNDLLILLGNCFSNAYENCGGLNFIRVFIRDFTEYSSLIIENSIDEERLDIDKLTTKKDLNIHGFGLKSIENTMSKIGGKVQLESKEYMFVCKLLLNRKVSCESEKVTK